MFADAVQSEWVPQGAADPTSAKSAPFDLPAGDWREVTVNLTEPGPLGTLRFYSPSGVKTLELDWIELRAKGDAKAQRWEFDAK